MQYFAYIGFTAVSRDIERPAMCSPRLLFVLLLFRASGAYATAPAPADVATGFYNWVIQHSGGGLPSASALTSGEALMSNELISLVRAATVTEQRCVAITPVDLKPLIFEGNMFVDNYEGLTSVLSMRLQKKSTRVLVTSRLQYRENRAGGDAHNWSDRLILARQSGRWVVADVGGPLRRKTLVATLKKYISANCGL